MSLIQLTSSMTETEERITQNSNNSYLNGAYNQNMFQNGFINGDMQVWQMGTSVVPAAANKYYTADMWINWRGGYAAGLTVTQVTYDSAVAKYALRAQRDVGDTSLAVIETAYNISSNESKKYIGKKVTFSFCSRVGANAAGSYQARIYTGTGTDQRMDSGFTGSVLVGTLTFIPTTSNQIFTVTTSDTIASNVTEIGVKISYTPSTATAGANDYIEITNCNWSATDFYIPFSPKSYDEELRACQYYFIRIKSYAAYGRFGLISAQSTADGRAIIPLPTTMRDLSTAPTLKTNGSFAALSASAVSLTISPAVASINETCVALAISSTGMTVNGCFALVSNNDTSAYIDLDKRI